MLSRRARRLRPWLSWLAATADLVKALTAQDLDVAAYPTLDALRAAGGEVARLPTTVLVDLADAHRPATGEESTERDRYRRAGGAA